MLKKPTWKKFFLIMIGILMFVAACYAENIIKPDGGNPLLKNLRVTRTWAPTGSCISTLDAKWVEPEAFPEAKKLINTGGLTVGWINRDIMGWKKNQARVYGALSPDHAASLWVKSEPIRDLVDLAIPAEEILALEYWDTYSQYRIIFLDETAADIDKLMSYIDEMIAKDAMPKGKAVSEWADGKKNIANKKGGGENRLWHVGKKNITVDPEPFVMEYIRPSAGGPHRVVLNPQHSNLNPCIYEADAYRSVSGPLIMRVNDRSGVGGANGWWPKAKPSQGLREWWPVAYPSVPGGDRIKCLKALTELVDNLVRIANRHGLEVSKTQKQALFNRFAETECNKPRPGGGPPAGYSRITSVMFSKYCRIWPDPRPFADPSDKKDKGGV